MPGRITTVFLDLDGTLLDEAELGNAVESTCNVVTAAFDHPIRVGQHDGRWFALPARAELRK
jgi:predicted component of type VI protein secretion system